MSTALVFGIFGLLAILGVVALFSRLSLVRPSLLLYFSGAYLFALTILQVMPEVFINIKHAAGYLIFAGFLTQVILDYFSKGIEHGHFHRKWNRNNFPIAMYAALCIHAFFEGLPFGHHHHMDPTQTQFFSAVLLHKIPVLLVVVNILRIYTRTKVWRVILLLFFIGLTPLATFIGSSMFEGEFAHATFVSYTLSFTVGVLLHVSTVILFEADKNHKFQWKKLAAILLAFGLAALI